MLLVHQSVWRLNKLLLWMDHSLSRLSKQLKLYSNVRKTLKQNKEMPAAKLFSASVASPFRPSPPNSLGCLFCAELSYCVFSVARHSSLAERLPARHGLRDVHGDACPVVHRHDLPSGQRVSDCRRTWQGPALWRFFLWGYVLWPHWSI